MKSLFKYLKGYKLQTILAPVFKMSEAVLELFVPVIMAAVIDVGITNADAAFVRSRCLMLVILAAAGLAISVTAQYFSAVAASGFAAVLRKELFSKIQTLSFGRMDQTGVSTMVTRLTSDVNQVQTGVNMVLRLLLRSPLVVVGAMVMAFFIDVRMALVFVVVIPLLALVICGVMSHNIPRYRNVQAQLDLLLGRTRESLTGVRIVRAFGKEEYLEHEFVEENQTLRHSQVRVGRIAGLLNPVTFVVVNLGIAAILAFGGDLTFGGELTQGEVVALVNYMSQILVELIKFANLIVTLTKSLACANRIADVLALPGEKEENEAAKEELARYAEAARADTAGQKDTADVAVEFSHVSFAYAKGAKNALDDISFVAKKGETVGIIGGTGAGKSTLVQLIGGYYMPQDGTVFVNGMPTEIQDLSRLRQGIGFVMQQAKLFTGTVRQNLLFAKKDADVPSLHAALQAAQAYEFVMEKPQGLETKVEQGGRNFSGGQRQRLSIARALVRRPQILILDDSSSALDYATDAALRHSLADYWKMGEKATVFVVAQRTSSIQYADKILVLDYGQLVGSGTHEELLATCSVYREIYESQLQKQSGQQEGE